MEDDRTIEHGLSVRHLRTLLEYRPATGELRWLPAPRPPGAGRPKRTGWFLGFRDVRGYRHIKIKGFKVRFKVHRLAVALMTGQWPAADVDHADTDPGNNKWANLREATRTQNRANTRAHRDSTGEYKGVRRVGRAYIASIGHGYRKHYLGTFPTALEAHTAYMVKAVELYGDFARAV